MLTTALNKSPKPPIIVDDILVTELNLGSVPPELEILEIGDLAEDRFRGIFKMCYTGDAFLTLKTRVQANPLNTYLSTKPSIVSPQPLAASSGLTIPLQITLSDIRLSGFVILVFSRQKGITLVFRNDPLESLKVSSTFDSIPFVRDYLQKEIEGQLRVLFMEDLPAIIHRLSLRLWVPEYQGELNSNGLEGSKEGQRLIDPLATPSQRSRDSFGHVVEEAEFSPLSPDTQIETHASFSQKNLFRLATLADSHRTISLFTPPIRDAVFRAWAGAAERGDIAGTTTPGPGFTLASLPRQHSSASNVSSSVYSFSDGGVSTTSSQRPSLAAFNSVYSGVSLGPGRSKAVAGRKRKTRVVNLRKIGIEADAQSVGSGPSTPSFTPPTSASVPASSSDEREGEITTPPQTPEKTAEKGHVRIAEGPPEMISPPPQPVSADWPVQTILNTLDDGPTLRFQDETPSVAPQQAKLREIPSVHELQRPRSYQFVVEKSPGIGTTYPSTQSGSILEQAWMTKMATEIARKVQVEKALSEGGGSFWNGDERQERAPPPAYAA